MSEVASAPAVATPEPSGIGGWLLLPAIALIISPLRMIYEFHQTFFDLLRPSVWISLLSTKTPNYSPVLATVLGWEILANLALFTLTIWLAYLFFKKRKLAPAVFILWIVVSAALQLADLMLTSLLGLDAQQSNTRSIIELVKSGIGAAIWVPYFRRSVRVKNTFVHDAPKPDY